MTDPTTQPVDPEDLIRRRRVDPAAGDIDVPPFSETYHRGPVILRGQMIPQDSTTANLLKTEQSTDWLHMDPWRVLRIQAEFVDGFGALAELGPAVSVFGSARTQRSDPAYRAAQRMGALIAERGIAVITGGGTGHHGGRQPRRGRGRRQIRGTGHRAAA